MQANSEKFQAISPGKKTHDKNIIFNLDGISIVCDDEVKMLGVTIDFKLNFNSHITTNVFVRRLDRFGKLTIYHSFIMSNFSYYPLIWHFCTEQNSPKIEKIQERPLQFIYNDSDSSYETLLSKILNYPHLKPGE
jgi:hypothetical protein